MPYQRPISFRPSPTILRASTLLRQLLRSSFPALILIALFTASLAHAQFRASIQGDVVDSTGAAIPGATVTLIDTDTNQKTTAVSSSSGTYNFNALAPDHFTVSAAAKGFQTKTIDAFTLVPEQANALNFQLDPAGATQSVTVNANAIPTLETQTASISGTVTTNQILHMPSFGRDVTQLAELAPGSVSDGSQAAGGGSNNLPGTNIGASGATDGIFKTENGPQVAANGGQTNTNNITIDGISTVSAVWGGTTVVTPTEDSVADVKVVTNDYDAEYGRFSGAQMIITSKSGSNQLHGSLFFKADRPGLNAYQRYNGPSSVGTGSASSRGLNRDESRFNQYGGSVGGPIIKNRLFFFFAYETLRNNGETTAQGWYDTPQFDAFAPAGSIASQYLTYPGEAVSGTVIPGGTCTTLGLTEGVNCNTIAGQGVNIGSPLTTPLGTHDPTWAGTNQPGVGSGLSNVPDIALYNTVGPNKVNEAQYNGRLDANATSKDHLNFTIYWVPEATEYYNGPTRAANLWHHESVNDAFSAIWNHTFSPNLINEARANAAGWRWNEVGTNPQVPFGLPEDTFGAVGNQFPNLATINYFGPPGPSVLNQWTYGYQDILTKIAGRHTIKMGASLTMLHYLSENVSASRPTFVFTDVWDFLNDAPYSENGNFNPLTGAGAVNRQDDRVDLYAGFIQDDWKVSPNLTINAGLRYNYFGPQASKENNQSVVDFGSGAALLTDLHMRVGGDLYTAQKTNFGPQLGFAYNPDVFNKKLVVRGGFGLNFNQNEIAITANGGSNVPEVLQETFCCSSAASPNSQVVYSPPASLTNINGYPANPNAITTFNTANLPTTTSVAVNGYDAFPKTPYTMHYSLDTQLELPYRVVASVGYQGSASRHLLIQNDENAVAAADGYPLNPAISHSYIYTNKATANNNEMIADIKHDFDHGFQLEATYTWAKSMDQGSQPYYMDPYPYAPRFAYGRSDYNVQNSFKAFGLWQPRFFHSNGALHKLADDWTFTGIYNLHSGFPWTPTVNTNGNLYFLNSEYTSLRPGAYLGGAGHNHSNAAFESGPNAINGESGFNSNYAEGALAYFTIPSYTTVPGTATATTEAPAPQAPGVSRNSLTGPGYQDVDASITKGFGLPKLHVLGDAARLEFRIDAFNLFNETNLNGSSIITNINNSTTNPTTGVVTQTSNPEFGQVQSALGSRTLDIQARFSF